MTSNREGTEVKFVQIRVKSVKHREKDAVTIYFYDVTHHIESLNLPTNASALRQNGDASMGRLKSDIQGIIIDKFRYPLSTMLMFFENLLNSDALSEELK